MSNPDPTHVAVPVQLYQVVQKVLQEELPMAKVRGIVMALEQCKTMAINPDAKPGDRILAPNGEANAEPE